MLRIITTGLIDIPAGTDYYILLSENSMTETAVVGLERIIDLNITTVAERETLGISGKERNIFILLFRLAISCSVLKSAIPTY